MLNRGVRSDSKGVRNQDHQQPRRRGDRSDELAGRLGGPHQVGAAIERAGAGSGAHELRCPASLRLPHPATGVRPNGGARDGRTVTDGTYAIDTRPLVSPSAPQRSTRVLHKPVDCHRTTSAQQPRFHVKQLPADKKGGSFHVKRPPRDRASKALRGERSEPQPAMTSSHAAPAAAAAPSPSTVTPSTRSPAANAARDASTTPRSAACP